MIFAKNLIIACVVIFSVSLMLSFHSAASAEDLTVAAGETKTLAAGKLEYGTIIIEAGATLELTGETDLTCLRMELRNSYLTFSGNTTITFGSSIAAADTTNPALSIEFGSRIGPKYPEQQYGDDGKDGYDLTLVVYGDIFVAPNRSYASGATITTYGQPGAYGKDGADSPGANDMDCGGGMVSGEDGTPGGNGGKGGNLTVLCNGKIRGDLHHDLNLQANGGSGGYGGSGGTGSDCGPYGNGGDGAASGKGAKSGNIHFVANSVETVRMNFYAMGGSGGGGGSGGRAGGAYGAPEGHGGPGSGTDGAAGADGGNIKIVTACGIDSQQLRVNSSGGNGGAAGGSGVAVLGGGGHSNTLGKGGNAGEITIMSPSINLKNTTLSQMWVAAGGRGGQGGGAGANTQVAVWSDNGNRPCPPAPILCGCVTYVWGVHSGDGNDGGNGGTIHLYVDTLTSSLPTADVSGGIGGAGGGLSNGIGSSPYPNNCYYVIDGATGETGVDGVFKQDVLGLNTDNIIAAVGVDKKTAAPGECVDYFVTLISQAPKNNVSTKLKVPLSLGKVSASPDVPMDFHNREVQWDTASLLACEAQTFSLTAKLSTTASGTITTYAEGLVNGVKVSTSENVSVLVDENGTCSGSCCSATTESIAPTIENLLKKIKSLISKAKKALPKKPPKGSKKNVIAKYKKTFNEISKARKELLVSIEELIELADGNVSEIKNTLPNYGTAQTSQLQKYVKTALAKRSSEKLVKKSWYLATCLVSKLLKH